MSLVLLAFIPAMSLLDRCCACGGRLCIHDNIKLAHVIIPQKDESSSISPPILSKTIKTLAPLLYFGPCNPQSNSTTQLADVSRFIANVIRVLPLPASLMVFAKIAHKGVKLHILGEGQYKIQNI